MRLYQQLILFMLAATVLPLAIVGFYVLRTSERELARRIGNEQRALAVGVAREASAQVMEAVDAVARATGAISDWSGASPEELKGALSLIYQQSQSARAVLLVSAEGQVVAGPVYVAEPAAPERAFQADTLPRLLSAIPVSTLRAGDVGQAALSPAYGGEEGAAVAVAVKVEAGTASPFVVAELSLAPLGQLLAERSTEAGRIELVDGRGRVLASGQARAGLAPLAPETWSVAKALLERAPSGSGHTSAPARQLVSAARAPGGIGAYAVVSVEERAALQSVWGLRKTVLLSIGVALVVLLLLGLAFTRRVNARLGRVVEGAEAFARGELSLRIHVQGADELADLSETFNRMGAELEAARTRMTRWNDDLKQKVDEATAELKAAQAQLLEAQKLAAVGQLGAGVAHEINNPLAGILGHTQLLLLDRGEGDPDFEALRKIELSAKRCKEITQNLLRFSQQRERPELRPCDLNAVVRDALSLTEKQLRGDGLTVELRLATGPLRVRGDPGHLSQVLLALISNARTAMAKSSRKVLSVHTRTEDDSGILEVSDTGKGIAPEHLPRIFEPFFTTKDVWSNVGLGLSVAYRVVSEHQGKVEVTTQVGVGTTLKVSLPGVPASPARAAS